MVSSAYREAVVSSEEVNDYEVKTRNIATVHMKNYLIWHTVTVTNSILVLFNTLFLNWPHSNSLFQRHYGSLLI